MRLRIKNAIESQQAIVPIELAKPLRYSFIDHHQIRVGDFLIVYRVDLSNQKIIIILIKFPKDVYEVSFPF